MTLKILFTGVVGGADGYGAANRGLIKYLQRHCTLGVIPIQGPARFSDESAFARGTVVPSATGIQEPDVHLIRTAAQLYPTLIGSRVPTQALWTVWELAPWPEYLLTSAKLADLIVTSSTFVQQNLAKQGVQATIVPEGVDPEHYYPDAQPRARFRFLFVGEWNTRKGVQRLIRAYSNAFAGLHDVELVLKLHLPEGLYPEDITPVLEHLSRQMGKSPARITTILGTVPDDRMFMTYNSCDVLVQPSHAEAWLRPALEAAFCGIPTIATGWGGQMDFLTDKNAWLLPFTMAPAADFADYRPSMQWADVAERDIAMALRYAYEHQKEVREKGQQALQLRDTLNWDLCAQKLVKVLEAAPRAVA